MNKEAMNSKKLRNALRKRAKLLAANGTLVTCVWGPSVLDPKKVYRITSGTSELVLISNPADAYDWHWVNVRELIPARKPTRGPARLRMYQAKELRKRWI